MSQALKDGAKVREEFLAKRRRHTMMIVPFAILIVAAWLTRGPDTVLGLEPRTFMILAVAACALAGAWSFYDWRCPACNWFLGRKVNPGACPRCGVALR
jgi:hypothetical protein